jgi:hypothetical protein
MVANIERDCVMSTIAARFAFAVLLLTLQLWGALDAPAAERPMSQRPSEPFELAQEPQRRLPFRAKIQGSHCVTDKSCPSGLSRVVCATNNPESCEPTGMCCRKNPPTRPFCGVRCPTTKDGLVQCCDVGRYCCTEFAGCCPNGTSCETILGINFCTRYWPF